MADSGEPVMSATHTLQVYIESQNDHDHKPGMKRVRAYNYMGQYNDVPLGNVYCEDIDDWDLSDKTFELFGDNPDGFR